MELYLMVIKTVLEQLIRLLYITLISFCLINFEKISSIKTFISSCILLILIHLVESLSKVLKIYYISVYIESFYINTVLNHWCHHILGTINLFC